MLVKKAIIHKHFIHKCFLDKHPDGSYIKKSNHTMIDLLRDPENCPVDFYRTGPDNTPRFLAGIRNILFEMRPFLEVLKPVPASRPSCWAYPDMLAIGKNSMQDKFRTLGCQPMDFYEEQTLFANWAIVSSPLILSFDVTNDTEVERLWPIIGNKLALEINNQWAGEAGRLLKSANTNFSTHVCGEGKDTTFPSWVIWSKKLSHPNNSVAFLAINIEGKKGSKTFSVTYDDMIKAGYVTNNESDASHVFVGKDVWSGKSIGKISKNQSWQIDVSLAHDSSFVIFSRQE